MFAVFTLFLVVILSILITRVATIALVHTGLSRESARFQARSALTGAGFTTKESEIVVNHPVRRRIIGLLMLIGNAGIVTAISTLILTFIDDGEEVSLLPRVVLLILGTVGLWFLAQSAWVDQHLSTIIDRILRKHGPLNVQDYVSLMHLAGDYRLVELQVETRDWIAGRTLAEAELSQEGILVLGIQRNNGTYLGAPRGSTHIKGSDILTLYGRVSQIEKLDTRRKSKRGDQDHLAAIEEQGRVMQEEAGLDPAEKKKRPKPQTE